MNKFEVEKDTIGDIIILPREQAVLMTYYRNNIAHMLVLPSLMAAIVTQHRHISCDVLMEHVNVLYPMLKAELFLRWDRDELLDVIDALANEMQMSGADYPGEMSCISTRRILARYSCWPQARAKRCNVMPSPSGC